MSNAPVSGTNLRGALDLSSLVRPPATSAAGGPGGAGGSGTRTATGGLVRSSTDATFTEILDLSAIVPVVIEFHGASSDPNLAAVVKQYTGRVALATVEAASNPQLVQAFKVDQTPLVAAVIGGRPIQQFAGMLSNPELLEVFDQLLQVAAQQGVTGTIEVSGGPDMDPGAGSVEPVEEPLPPHHQEAYDAIVAGDFATAIAEYETAIVQNPRDQLAVAGLAQVSLLARLDGQSADAVRSAASAALLQSTPIWNEVGG